MPGPKLGKNFGTDSFAALINVCLPESLLNRALVLGPHVEQRELSLSAKGLALKNGGEDRATINVK